MSAASAPRFTLLDSGVIHDALLNLEWAPESIRCNSQHEAIEKAAALGDGFRAPTRSELASLVDDTRRRPACDPVLNMPFDDWHWSSSPVVGWPEYAWFVYFYIGFVGSSLRDYSGFVRPVRVARPRQ